MNTKCTQLDKQSVEVIVFVWTTTLLAITPNIANVRTVGKTFG